MESVLTTLSFPHLCGSWRGHLAETLAVLLQIFSSLQQDISKNRYVNLGKWETLGASKWGLPEKKYVKEGRAVALTVLMLQTLLRCD